MSESHFIWPEPRFLSRGLASLSLASADRLESVLRQRFPGRSVPVVVSSGRAALVLALEALGVRRPDTVELFPYASHCVIEAVGRVGSPMARLAAPAGGVRVVYHQWGYVQERAVGGLFVEDAVDSFCLTSQALFPAGGAFEVWSLPKLLGCLGGGVLWCKDEATAAAVRVPRDSRRALTTTRWLLRLLSPAWPRLVPLWYGAESAGGAPPAWAGGDILAALQAWDQIADERRRRLAVMRGSLPGWLTIDSDRLPTAVPVEADEQQGRALAALGFSAGFRHFERIDDHGRRTLMRTFPIPVHQNVPLRLLESARRVLSNAA